MHDGGILTVVPYLLQKSRVWRKCRLRIICVAQDDDNPVQMHTDLKTLLTKFRIDAEAMVLELGGYDITEFAHEKTMRMQQRTELLTEMKIASQNEVLWLNG
jgi:hypothetical protein